MKLDYLDYIEKCQDFHNDNSMAIPGYCHEDDQVPTEFLLPPIKTASMKQLKAREFFRPRVICPPQVLNKTNLPDNYNFETVKADDLLKYASRGAIDLSCPPNYEIHQLPDNLIPGGEKINLSPATPTVQIGHKKECYTRALAAFCHDPRVPLVVLRGMTYHLKIDLGKFSTKHFREKCPHKKMEIRTQAKQKTTENWNQEGTEQTWACISYAGTIEMHKYGEYQIKTLQEAFKKEQLARSGQQAARWAEKPSSRASFSADILDSVMKNVRAISINYTTTRS